VGPRGHELGDRQVVPVTTETASVWNAIEALGEFDRVTVIGPDPGNLGARIARESQRPLRTMTHGGLYWSRVIERTGVELAITLAPRFTSSLYHDGFEVPGIDVGWQLVRKDKRLREYLAPRVLERKGEATWLRRMTRALDEILAVWNPTTLYVAVPETVPLPAALPSRVVTVASRDSFDDALLAWNDWSEPELRPS